jgi:hypothetical protein
LRGRCGRRRSCQSRDRHINDGAAHNRSGLPRHDIEDDVGLAFELQHEGDGDTSATAPRTQLFRIDNHVIPNLPVALKAVQLFAANYAIYVRHDRQWNASATEPKLSSVLRERRTHDQVERLLETRLPTHGIVDSETIDGHVDLGARPAAPRLVTVRRDRD